MKFFNNLFKQQKKKVKFSFRSFSGSIVIWSSVFLYNFCLIWTIVGISFDPKLYPHLIISCACCLLTSLIYRTTMYFLHQGTDFQTYYEKFRFWVGPEIIYALICLSNFIVLIRIKCSTCTILKKLTRYYDNIIFLSEKKKNEKHILAKF